MVARPQVARTDRGRDGQTDRWMDRWLLFEVGDEPSADMLVARGVGRKQGVGKPTDSPPPQKKSSKCSVQFRSESTRVYYFFLFNKLQCGWPRWSPWRLNVASTVERSPDIFLQGRGSSWEMNDHSIPTATFCLLKMPSVS